MRAVNKDGQKILHDVNYQEYDKYIDEEVRSWSYMKFPYLKKLADNGWYSVGPLARMNTADSLIHRLHRRNSNSLKITTAANQA